MDMSTAVPVPPAAPAVPAPPARFAPSVLRASSPAARKAAGRVVPAWFASVMGTGVVAVALKLLPVRLPGAEGIAIGFWMAAAVLLVGLTAAVLLTRATACRAIVADAALAPTLGVPAMGAMTVGAATAAVGRPVLGGFAIGLAMALWAIGTVGGVVVAVVVSRALVVAHRVRLEDVSGTWLLAVVPPVVSASTGAGLVAHVPAGEARLDLLIVLYALFGLGLLASLPTIALLWARLVLHGPGPAERAPALWVVLGPLGQSITAAALLGAASEDVLPAPTAAALQALGLAYGLVVAGFAALWLALAVALTRHHATREGVPFSAAWWSFVFPVGTLVTGTSELAARTGSEALRAVALALFAGLLTAWTVTATRALAASAPAARRRRRPA